MTLLQVVALLVATRQWYYACCNAWHGFYWSAAFNGVVILLLYHAYRTTP